MGLDAKGMGAAVVFHSLPVTDFTLTAGTPGQIESHRQSPQMDHSGRHTVATNFFLHESKIFHLICTRDILFHQ